MTNTNSASWQASLAQVFLQFFALVAFGLGQPLLQLVRRNPDFLMVHHAKAPDVLIMAGALLVLPAVILGLVVLLTGLIHPLVRKVTHRLFLALLFFLVLLPLVDRLPGVDGLFTLIGAAALALAVLVGLEKIPALRQVLTWSAVAVPVFLMLFLGAGPIRRIILLDSVLPDQGAVAVPNPVIMIICDEFPTASLLRPDQGLDADLAPNFARLAGMSTWYRNASTISSATLRAVPAIMTGRLPRWDESPSLADHPRNIFTFLGPTHQVTSLESQTDLCPDDLKSEPVPDLRERLDLVFSDLSVLYQHVVVPRVWRPRLIPVDNKWGDYRGKAGKSGAGGPPVTKMDRFRRFIASIEAGEKPNLAVAHFLLPHNPYRFFPDGHVYTWRDRVPLDSQGIWGRDELVIAHSYRRHLIQVAAVDQLLGELLDQLEDQGLLQEALLVVTADHGASFQAGLSHRRFSDDNAADIMSVPLFIKLPNQAEGAIDDRFVQTVDIMPTLVAALEPDSGWDFDGMDLAVPSHAQRAVLDFMDPDRRIHREIAPEKLAERNATVQWKNSLFESEGGYERLFAMGPAADLLGKAVSAPDIPESSGLQVRIMDLPRLADVNRDRLFVPAEIQGTLDGYQGDGRLTLAVALNGVLAGVTQTYLQGPEPDRIPWQFLVPPETLLNGRNQVDLFLVEGDAPAYRLSWLPVEGPSFLGEELGSEPVLGVHESGLFTPGRWAEGLARWTKGQGRWTIPLQQGERPTSLDLDLASTGPAGTHLKVIVDQRVLLEADLPGGPWQTSLALNDLEPGRRISVTLDSSVFVPSRLDPGSQDHRELGVAVRSLILR